MPRGVWPRPSMEERFWRRVQKTDSCWTWVGSLDGHGYGQIRASGPRDVTLMILRAHRYSYELHVGPIPEGLNVCHHCDNPRCVRPDHLFVGTARDNAIDMVRKGRNWSPFGHHA